MVLLILIEQLIFCRYWLIIRLKLVRLNSSASVLRDGVLVLVHDNVF